MSYLKQDLIEYNYLKHLVLIYGDGRRLWTPEELKYYVAHLQPDGKPDDWLFDSFLFINRQSGSGKDFVADVNLGKSMSGEGDFHAVCSPNPAGKSDWEDLLDYYFGEEGALRALDRTIGEVSQHLKSPAHKRNVVLTLPYPHITQEHFGRLDGASEELSFSAKKQGLTRATYSRLEAAVWFVDKVAELWKKAGFKHLNLLGVYWVFETIYRSWDIDDHVLLKELRKHINSRGMKFLWIPFYATYNFHLLSEYEKYYFDMAFLQPNFLFYRDGKDIETAAAVARKCRAGIEMEYYLELDEPISIRNEKQLRFREYLNGGVKYGYMTDSACAHFQDANSLEGMHAHSDPVEREFYDDIYNFVKGTYQPKPYPPVPAGAGFIPRKRGVIALDLGGTNLRMGLVDDSGKIMEWRSQRTPANRKAIIDAIISEVGEGIKLAKSQNMILTGIGMSTGGRVNFRSGIIEDSTALIPEWRNVNLRIELEKKFGIPFSIDNDGNCSAIADKVFGKARDSENFVSIVLGTGVGGGIYVDGKLLRGENNYTSEIGHITVDANGPVCSCGSFGCVELFASGAGLLRWAEEKDVLDEITGDSFERSAKGISDSARAGNKTALDLLTSAGEKLGAAAAVLVDIFNPSMIVFSGSLVGIGDCYFDAFTETLKRRAIKPAGDDVRITFSDFKNEIGIVGAAALAFENIVAGTLANESYPRDSEGKLND